MTPCMEWLHDVRVFLETHVTYRGKTRGPSLTGRAFKGDSNPVRQATLRQAMQDRMPQGGSDDRKRFAALRKRRLKWKTAGLGPQQPMLGT